MKQDIVDRLLFMAQVAMRGGLKNLSAGLVEAAQDVASLKWELKVLKQKRSKK